MLKNSKISVGLFVKRMALSLTTLALVAQVSVPAFGACRVLNGQAVPAKTIHRGMYFSPRTVALGDATLPSKDQNILGNIVNENILLEYIVQNGIDSLSYYNLNKILTNSALTKNLSSFILAAKDCGVVEANAIGSVNSDWVKIKNYQANNAGKFTGLITEVEFWNASAAEATQQFNYYLAMLKYMKSLDMTANGMPLKIGTYLGWLNKVPSLSTTQVAAKIAPLLDRVYLHCYVQSASTAFGYCKSRIEDFVKSGKKVELFPIFSAEGKGFSFGSDVFMGDWFRANSIVSAEKLFSAGYSKQYPNGNLLNFNGFQYYEYAFLSYFIPGLN